MKAPAESVKLPRWLVAWHFVAAVLLVILVWFSYQNLHMTGLAAAEMRKLNRFFDSTLVSAQRRVDSVRARDRRLIDSLNMERR